MPSIDSEPLIAVKMTARAAEELAKACQWASYRAQDILDDRVAYSDSAVERAEKAYEWLSWGSGWMRNEEARVDATR